MLMTIIHASLAHDPSDRDTEKKQFMALVKKVRNQIGERASRTKQSVRQLLPIVRMPRHIIAVESNEKSQYPGIDLIDRVPGLRATEKQKVNTWDLIEGNSKNPAPLSWAWFGAVKMERRPMKYERGFDLLKYHTHNLAKPRTFYYEPLVITVKEPAPTLPPDDTNLVMNMNNMPTTSMASVPMVCGILFFAKFPACFWEFSISVSGYSQDWHTIISRTIAKHSNCSSSTTGGGTASRQTPEKANESGCCSRRRCSCGRCCSRTNAGKPWCDDSDIDWNYIWNFILNNARLLL